MQYSLFSGIVCVDQFRAELAVWIKAEFQSAGKRTEEKWSRRTLFKGREGSSHGSQSLAQNLLSGISWQEADDSQFLGRHLLSLAANFEVPSSASSLVL